MKNFIKDAGEDDSDNLESDFMLYTCHGVSSGSLYDDDSNLIMQASDMSNASDWDDDVEWVWSDSCLTLNVAGGGRNAWDDALFGTTRPAHAILGYYDNVGSNQTDEIDTFFDYAAGQDATIVSSFYNACTDGWNDPGALIEHKDNDSDKLKTVTRDTSSTTLRYYSLSGGWTPPSDYTKGGMGEIERLTIGEHRINVVGSLPRGQQPDLGPVEAELVPVRQTPTGFNYFQRRYGLRIFWKPVPHQGALKSQDQDTVESMARDVITEMFGGIGALGAFETMESVFNVTDFERGSDPDESESIALVRSVEYLHYHNGIRIAGDIIGVAASRDELVKIRTCWHNIVEDKSEQRKHVASAEQAVAVAVRSHFDRYPQDDDAPADLLRANLCYYGYHSAGNRRKSFVPAWQFALKDRGRFYYYYVNAIDKSMIDYRTDIRDARQEYNNQQQ